MLKNIFQIGRDWFLFLLPPAILGAWGCLLLYLWKTNNLTLLQHPRYHSFTLASAFVLLTTSLIYPLLYDPISSPLKGSPFRMFLKTLLCFLPVAFFLQFPINYDMAGLLNRPMGGGTDLSGLGLAAADDKPPQWLLDVKKEGIGNISLMDILVAAAIPSARPHLEGIEVNITGQWLLNAPAKKENQKEDPVGEKVESFRFVRLLMFCCAADARPIGLIAKGKKPESEPGSWIQLRARLHVSENIKELPWLEVISTDAAEAPADVFVY